jgi:FlaA1/EpsC-like NDP-sugar epimerase
VTVVDAMVLSQLTMPRSVLLLDWGASLTALAGLRAAQRLFRDGLRNPFAFQSGTAVLIVGANDAGEGLLRAIKRSAKLDYRPVGFVDDRDRHRGRRMCRGTKSYTSRINFR